MENILERIKCFTVQQTGVKVDEITPEAGLEEDLGVSGDDALDYLVAFAKEFNVDISRFMASKYISPEGDLILPAIIRAFTGNEGSKQKELRICHLEKAVISGRLDEETINS